MTPTHTEKPLRRSEAGAFRATIHQTPVLNDDEEERRERRRIALEESTVSSTIDENETLKNCIQICVENKIKKEEAWSVSVIDTLSKLLEKHHKAFNNFKVAGTSLEASSKIYGLRVDSIHTDVLRLSAGLNKKKFKENNDDEDYESNRDDGNQTQSEQQKGGENNTDEQNKQQTRKKRARKPVPTITKNKETINAKLDTYPLTDPMFGILNSTIANINSSARLLQNILPSHDSQILANLDFKFWDPSPPEELVPIDADPEEYEKLEKVSCELFCSLTLDDLCLRPVYTGYEILDTPAEQDTENEKELDFMRRNMEDEGNLNPNESQLAMAFDINAEVEPSHSETPGFLDVDMDEMDDLSADEQIAITNCRALRRQPIVIEDMRPIDSASTHLEYSYRPVQKISQYWAGPSHWKFKRTTRNNSLLHQYNEKQLQSRRQGDNRQSKRLIVAKKIDFSQSHDELFLKINKSTMRKLRKANIQKKWDAKKFKLPTDLHMNSSIFDTFQFAPGLQCQRAAPDMESIDLDIPSGYDYNNPIDREYCPNIINDDDGTDIERDTPASQDEGEGIDGGGTRILPSQSYVEIATEFHGAPEKVTRIIVPFAKRAKVVDMKQLKKCCMHIIKNKFACTSKDKSIEQEEKENNESSVSSQINDINSNLFKNEKYVNGIATFTQIYTELPNLLTSKMTDALSPSIAFYSILHLANETNLRLIPQDDLRDFKILQLDTSASN